MIFRAGRLLVVGVIGFALAFLASRPVAAYYDVDFVYWARFTSGTSAGIVTATNTAWPTTNAAGPPYGIAVVQEDGCVGSWMQYRSYSATSGANYQMVFKVRILSFSGCSGTITWHSAWKHK